VRTSDLEPVACPQETGRPNAEPPIFLTCANYLTRTAMPAVEGSATHGGSGNKERYVTEAIRSSVGCVFASKKFATGLLIPPGVVGLKTKSSSVF